MRRPSPLFNPAHSPAEQIRRVLRRLVRNPFIYGHASHAFCQLQTLRLEGWNSYRTLYRPPRWQGEQRNVRLHSSRVPFYFRPGTQDVIAIVQNIVRQEYGYIPLSEEPEWILDGGAYIGDVSYYFLARFPSIRVLSFEPNPSSCALAQKNLAPFGERSILYHKGLWSHRTVMQLQGEFMDAQLTLADGGDKIECIDIGTLLRTHSIREFDLVKLDVEHAEREILTVNSEQWLCRTRALVVEFHSQDIQDECLDYLGARGWEGFPFRELYYLLNVPLMERNT